MERGLSVMLDLMVTAVVIAALAPVIILCIGVFRGGDSYGFGTLEDKSVMSTPAQMRNLGMNVHVREKRMWSNIHLALMPVVDGRGGAHTITRGAVPGGVVPSGTAPGEAEHAYTIGASTEDERYALINSARGAFNASPGSSENWYHISISEDGDVRATYDLQEVD